MQIPLVLVMKKGRDLHSVGTLATVDYLAGEAGNVVDLESTSLLLCNTQQECMDAVPALSLVLIEEGIISVKIAHHHLVRPGDIILLLRGEHNCLVQTALVELVHELCLQLRLVHLQIRNGIIQLPHHIVGMRPCGC